MNEKIILQNEDNLENELRGNEKWSQSVNHWENKTVKEYYTFICKEIKNSQWKWSMK